MDDPHAQANNTMQETVTRKDCVEAATPSLARRTRFQLLAQRGIGWWAGSPVSGSVRSIEQHVTLASGCGGSCRWSVVDCSALHSLAGDWQNAAGGTKLERHRADM